MSCILYYSKYCDVCKKYLQLLSKTECQKDVHFICIDKRIKEANNKIYIVLDNGQKIILPENVTKVPALLLLNQGYQVLFGEQILQFLKPVAREEVAKATYNNMEPMATSYEEAGYLGGGFGGVMSDQYSYYDQDADELKADGNGGMRQMHNYVDLNTAFNGKISDVPNNEEFNTTIRGAKKMGEDMANDLTAKRLKQMEEERAADLSALSKNRPPMAF